MDLAKLTASISEAADLLARQPAAAHQQREELLKACQKLSASLEQPREQLERATIAMTPVAAVRIAIDMGIFDFVHRSSKEDFTGDELATAANADPLLVVRILRSLVVSRVFTVTALGSYRAEPVVQNLIQGGCLASFIIMHFDIHFQIIAKLPSYLRETKYRSPENAHVGPFQHCFSTDKHFFNWLVHKPTLLAAFNQVMQTGVARHNVQRWTQTFPVTQRLQEATFQGTARLKLVDVGGGGGHESKVLLETLPWLKSKGEIILQDIPGVIESMLPELKETAGCVQAMPHDFFEPQPVKHAQIYFLGRVLHDWPDTQARIILRHIRDAMHGDSLLLIHDRVLPEGPAQVHPSDALVDLHMMALLSSLERTERQFRVLLDSVGLRLVRVWRPVSAGHHRQAVLEVVRGIVDT